MSAFNDWFPTSQYGINVVNVTSNPQAAIDAAGDQTVLRAPQNTNFTLTSTLLISDRNNVHFNATGPRSVNNVAASPTRGSVLIWDGAAGGTVVSLDKARGCGLKGWVVRGEDANVGIKIDGYASGQICTENILEDLIVIPTGSNASWIGLDISPVSTNNVEFIKVRGSLFYGATTGKACRIAAAGSANAHGHVFDDCKFQNGAIGLHAVKAGFKFEGLTGFNANDIDIKIESQNGPVIIENANSENSKQFLDLAGSDYPTMVRGCRIEPLGMAAGTGTIKFGASAKFVIIEGNLFGAATAGAYTFDFTLAENLILVLIGNRYFAGAAHASLHTGYDSTKQKIICIGDDLFGAGRLNTNLDAYFTAKIFMPNLPTTDPLVPGQLWTEGGWMAVSTGSP